MSVDQQPRGRLNSLGSRHRGQRRRRGARRVMTSTGGSADLALEPARRAAAVGALVLVAAALVVAAAGLRRRRRSHSPRSLPPAAAGDRHGLGRGPRGRERPEVRPPSPSSCSWCSPSPLVLTAEDHGVTLIVVLALLGGSTLLVRYALRRDRLGALGSAAGARHAGARRRAGVLLRRREVRRRQGGAVRSGRGVPTARHFQPVVLQPGDDLLELAQRADRQVARTSSAWPAATAAGPCRRGDRRRRRPSSCVPAGTRNHFGSTSASTATTWSPPSTPSMRGRASHRPRGR